MKSLILVFLTASTLFAYPVILKESKELPLTVFNVTFRVGSADDAKDTAGIANLTAGLLEEGGVKAYEGLPKRSREEIQEFLFPLAASIEVSASKEQTSIRVSCTAENADTLFDLLTQMILAPEFSDSELDRLKSEAKDVLEKRLPLEDQEELGKAALERSIYGADHPYSHVLAGTSQGVAKINKEMIENFYKTHFTQKKLTVAAGGVISDSVKKKLGTVFLKLPVGTDAKAFIPKATPKAKMNLVIVTGPFDSTGVHLGISQPVTRNSTDFPAMNLGSMAFGKHRSFVGRLMKTVREIRGLNYGAYSYIEEFPNGGHSLVPPNQVSRQLQAFTMWARPTTVPNGCFLLKQIIREFDNISTKGLTEAEFQLGKGHLTGVIPLLGTVLSRQIGYAIDSNFYGIEGDFLSNLQRANDKLTRKEVNAALAKNLSNGKPTVVVVTKDAAAFLKELKSGQCPIHYPDGVKKEKSVLAEDVLISKYPIAVDEKEIQVVSSKDFF